MPYRVSWHLPERIIHIELQGVITLQDILECSLNLRQCIKTSARTVHILVDVQQLKLFPANIQQIYNNYPRRLANTGCTILIGGTPVMQFTANVLGKLIGVRMKLADTVDAAIAMLCRQDDALVEHLTPAPIPDTLA
jgi:hypothetical protein